jgi:hypothetical protein
MSLINCITLYDISVISWMSKKNGHYNDQKIKDKRTTNDLQNTTQKNKDRVTRTNPTIIVNYYLLHTLHMVRHAYHFLLSFSIIS